MTKIPLRAGRTLGTPRICESGRLARGCLFHTLPAVAYAFGGFEQLRSNARSFGALQSPAIVGALRRRNRDTVIVDCATDDAS